MHIAVNLRFVNKSTQAAVEGVLVKILSLDLSTVYLEALTDGSGLVYPLLPEEETYEVRLFHPEVRYPNRHRLTTQSSSEGESQALKLEVEIRSVEDSADPRLCRVWERFLGSPFPGGFVHVNMADAAIVSPEGVRVPTPIAGKIDKGLFQVEVPSGSKVQFGLPGSEGQVEVEIPDVRSIRLTDLIFPYITAATYGDIPGETLTVAAGETEDVELTFEFSDASTKSPHILSGQWKVTLDGEASEGLVVMTTGENKIQLQGATPGIYSVEFVPVMNDSYFPVSLAVKRNPAAPTPENLPLTVEVT